MKMKSLAIASITAVALQLPIQAAGEEMIAGWDFSQYAGASFLIVDGVNFTNTLDTNYSNLDPTFGAGMLGANFQPPGSDAFGTMYMDGSFGSSSVDPDAANNPAFIPTAGSLQSNLDAGVPGSEPFDSHLVLASEGQLFTQFLSMTARDAVDVVFQADLSSVSQTRSNWAVSFGGQTLSGTAQVAVDFSTDGSSYANFGSVELTDVDSVFQVALGADSSEQAFVRLRFPAPLGEGVNQAVIDNVAITVPEPGSDVLAAAALLGVGGLLPLRRRRAGCGACA